MDSHLLSELPMLCAYAALGALAGYCALSALRWNVALYCRGCVAAAPLHVVRFIAVAAALAAFARIGAAALIASLVGFRALWVLSLRRQVAREAS